MPRPIRNLTLRRRAPEEIEADRERINRLAEFVPGTEALRPLVVAHLKRVYEPIKKDSDEHWKKLSWRKKFDAMFGMSLLIFWASFGRLYEWFHEDKKKDSARNKYAGMSPEEAEVEEEIVHARSEIVRGFVYTLEAAWEMWGEPREGVVLNNSLLPDTDKCKCPDSCEWEEHLEEARSDVSCSVALSESDLDSAMKIFRINVKQALQEGPVELPRGLDIVLDDNNQPHLKARGR